MFIMYFAKCLVLALAAATGVTAFPCSNCQLPADLSSPTNTDNLTDITHNNSLARRKAWEEMVHMNDWRDYTWDPEEKKKWNKKVQGDFDTVIKSHLPGYIELPSPLLPTSNEEFKKLYKRAVIEAMLYEDKPTERRRLEFAKLKRVAQDFMIASRCQWNKKDCAVYDEDLLKWTHEPGKDMYHESVTIGPDGKDFLKERVYDPLREECEKQVEMEALINLGKQLHALGFPQMQE
jgi:hypothetical protein